MGFSIHLRIRWVCRVLSFCFLVFTCAMSSAQEWVRVSYVPDGDTIILKDGRHIRYIGIDTPEIDHENHRAEPMGHEARSMNRELVDGKRIRIETDREPFDHFGRTLAYVYREDGLLVNAELLKHGLATVLYRFPNIRYADSLLKAQQEAMKNEAGLWRLVRQHEERSRYYLGNRRSRRFHTGDCPSGKKMSKKNRVHLTSRWQAFWEGYSPHKACIQFP